MIIFRHNDTGKCYTIEHLVYDYKHLNNNAFAGIYAYPYLHKGQVITFISNDYIGCRHFVLNNFKPISKT